MRGTLARVVRFRCFHAFGGGPARGGGTFFETGGLAKPERTCRCVVELTRQGGQLGSGVGHIYDAIL